MNGNGYVVIPKWFVSFLSFTVSVIFVGAVLWAWQMSIERLLRGFDHNVASVAAPYPSQFHKGYVAWTTGRQIIEERPVPALDVVTDDEGEPFLRYAQIEGNGFGCTLCRVDVFHEALFTARQQPYVDFDPAFYERLNGDGGHRCRTAVTGTNQLHRSCGS